MKYELLKRTAIALFVGGIVSTYAIAEDKSVEDALTELGKAIKADATKQNEKIEKINTSLSKATDRLVGVAANSYNNTLTLNGFKAGDIVYDVDTNTNKVTPKEATAEDVEADPLKGKGVINSINDITSDVDDLEKEIIKTVETVNDHTKVLDGDGTDANPGLVTKVNNLEDDVYGDGTDANPGLVGVVDKHTEAIYGTDGLMEVVRKQTEAINDLKAYNSLDDVKALVANKADKTDVDANKAEIAKKANASDVYTKTESDSKLDAKANASDVYTKTESDSKLNAKANVADVYSKTETDNKFALKADNSVVSAQAADISNLRTDVNAHTKRLDHLDNRVNKLDKDLKRGLAAQAALTGLFQPYTVGKANFTAAVGGYKSQTAVAIGTGYRYNQNIATKAGVAFTQGGGVTYNAGVNFEW